MTSSVPPSHNLQSNFDNAASTYEHSALLAQEINTRLFERLDLMQIKPKLILELGVGPGQLLNALEKRYRKAQIIGLDISTSMLKAARKKSPWFTRQKFCCANGMNLPLPNQCIDLIYSNLLLYHCQDYKALFQELSRVLKPDGLLLFSTLGPDTYIELRQLLPQFHINFNTQSFIDMHYLGDSLLQAKFKDPVMDMEKITFSYSKLDTLISDLHATGEAYFFDNFSVLEKNISEISELYKTQNPLTENFPVSYEIIYGHAWGVEKSTSLVTSSAQEAVIPVSHIKKIRKEK